MCSKAWIGRGWAEGKGVWVVQDYRGQVHFPSLSEPLNERGAVYGKGLQQQMFNAGVKRRRSHPPLTNSLTAVARSLTCRRLPKLNLVSIRIQYPTEFSVLRTFRLPNDVAALAAQCTKKGIQVVYTEIDHERCGARFHLVRVFSKRSPKGHSWRAIRTTPLKNRSAPLRDVQSKVVAIPRIQCLWIFRLKEDSTDSCNTLHGALRLGSGLFCGLTPKLSSRAGRST